MMKKIIPGILTICVFFLCSCDKNKPCKTSLETPVITGGDLPVTAGDSLILSIPKIENATYGWFGPFQFHSDSSSIKMIAYDTQLSGMFQVQYFTQDCLSDLATADIVVNPLVIPCNYATNHGEVISSWPAITYNHVYIYASSDSIHYSINAIWGTNGDISLDFAANSKPQNGVYTIVDDYYTLPGQVHFSFDINNDYWVVPKGKVYVNTVNGKLVATWCNLLCRRLYDGHLGTTSGNLTEP